MPSGVFDHPKSTWTWIIGFADQKGGEGKISFIPRENGGLFLSISAIVWLSSIFISIFLPFPHGPAVGNKANDRDGLAAFIGFAPQ